MSPVVRYGGPVRRCILIVIMVLAAATSPGCGNRVEVPGATATSTTGGQGGSAGAPVSSSTGQGGAGGQGGCAGASHVVLAAFIASRAAASRCPLDPPLQRSSYGHCPAREGGGVRGWGPRFEVSGGYCIPLGPGAGAAPSGRGVSVMREKYVMPPSWVKAMSPC